MVGTVDRASRTIRFGGIGGNTAGWTPAVALNNANGVVVAYQRPVSGAQALWYRVGIVDPANATITLGPEQRMMNGSFPSVALDDEGWLLAVYEGTGDDWPYSPTCKTFAIHPEAFIRSAARAAAAI